MQPSERSEQQDDLPRTLTLPRGRHLTIRHATVDDAAGLGALYEMLPLDDRYRRFFSAFRPGDQFLRRWAGAAGEGGCCLLAVDDEGTVVAEAGYLPLADGDAELAVTVTPAWRGWLGPYLLDQLLVEAAAAGLPNLEAEVLLENRPMLTVLRARGYVTLEHDDPTTVRVLVGASQRTPVWPPRDGRPRLLVEVPGARWGATSAAGRAGLQVLACPGPTGGVRCPRLDGAPCPLADDADLVITALSPSDPRTAAIVEGHARAGCPRVVVEVADPSVADELPATVVRVRRGRPLDTLAVAQDLLARTAGRRARATMRP